MDVLTAMPEALDLEFLRAQGPQPDEVLQPSTEETSAVCLYTQDTVP